MSDLFDRHIEIIESVNNAKTELEHRSALERLGGFRLGLGYPMHKRNKRY